MEPEPRLRHLIDTTSELPSITEADLKLDDDAVRHIAVVMYAVDTLPLDEKKSANARKAEAALELLRSYGGRSGVNGAINALATEAAQHWKTETDSAIALASFDALADFWIAAPPPNRDVIRSGISKACASTAIERIHETIQHQSGKEAWKEQDTLFDMLMVYFTRMLIDKDSRTAAATARIGMRLFESKSAGATAPIIDRAERELMLTNAGLKYASFAGTKFKLERIDEKTMRAVVVGELHPTADRSIDMDDLVARYTKSGEDWINPYFGKVEIEVVFKRAGKPTQAIVIKGRAPKPGEPV
ncbi:MAG: hypothetical protein JO019_03570 [Candidatus Kaiserbacteria bacterium]|nr:hypothetical protein [Candidatus Kaiserbacteria bacterium]